MLKAYKPSTTTNGDNEAVLLLQWSNANQHNIQRQITARFRAIEIDYTVTSGSGNSKFGLAVVRHEQAITCSISSVEQID